MGSRKGYEVSEVACRCESRHDDVCPWGESTDVSLPARIAIGDRVGGPGAQQDHATLLWFS